MGAVRKQGEQGDKAEGGMGKIKIAVKNLNLYYGGNHALKDINMEIRERVITAFIGPSGCGKSTFLKCINRMNDLVEGVRIEGKVLLDGEDIYDRRVDTTLLRKKVGMVFQQPNPFPMSIFDNVAYGMVSDPPLSTVHVYKQELGARAVRELLSADRTDSKAKVKIQVCADFIERGSVKEITG